jgi:hypothetical protein
VVANYHFRRQATRQLNKYTEGQIGGNPERIGLLPDNGVTGVVFSSLERFLQEESQPSTNNHYTHHQQHHNLQFTPPSPSTNLGFHLHPFL